MGATVVVIVVVSMVLVVGDSVFKGIYGVEETADEIHVTGTEDCVG
jgi:hypothetical protein